MTETIENHKTFKGFELFNDITDLTLRTRNQAVVLANIAADNSKAGLITPKGAALILGYFQHIAMEERAIVKDKFKLYMNERGFKLAA
jgi:hypothetical protein